MSVEKNRGEASRWLETAGGDLETARVLLSNARWAHCCFHAQQAAEKALKALWYSLDGDPWGHSVVRLVDDLSEIDAPAHKGMADLAETAARLDRYYIPTRYPNGLPDITPDRAFFEADAREAIEAARRILERVASLIG